MWEISKTEKKYFFWGAKRQISSPLLYFPMMRQVIVIIETKFGKTKKNWVFLRKSTSRLDAFPIFSKKVRGWKRSRPYWRLFYFFCVNLIVLRVSSKNIDIFRKKSRKKTVVSFWIATWSQSKLLRGGFEILKFWR